MSNSDFGTIYPSLGRYFENQTQLAHAGCMSRSRLADILDGKKQFTRAERKAISANIIAKELCKPLIDEKELSDAVRAYKGEFDEIYKRKAGT